MHHELSVLHRPTPQAHSRLIIVGYDKLTQAGCDRAFMSRVWLAPAEASNQ